MMAVPPDPPDGIPQYVLDALDHQNPDTLRRIAAHATALARHHERADNDSDDDHGGNDGDCDDDHGGNDDDSDDETVEDAGDQTREESKDTDTPESDDVPSRATITIKEINDNRYYYWQWRDGQKVRSKYKGPVGRDE